MSPNYLKTLKITKNYFYSTKISQKILTHQIPTPFSIALLVSTAKDNFDLKKISEVSFLID